jgi:hypothetical protein
LLVDFGDNFVASLNFLLLSEGVFAGDGLELRAGRRGDAEDEQQGDDRFANHDLALWKRISAEVHFSYWKKDQTDTA